MSFSGKRKSFRINDSQKTDESVVKVKVSFNLDY